MMESSAQWPGLNGEHKFQKIIIHNSKKLLYVILKKSLKNPKEIQKCFEIFRFHILYFLMVIQEV
jgi:hypothetical protein